MRKYWLISYAVAAIVTFGYVAHSIEKLECNVIQNGKRFGHNIFDYALLKECPTPLIAIEAIVAAAVWPLYWSWELQS